MASDSDRARALLTYANYAKVATALQVSRTAVAEWAKGRSVNPFRLRQLEQLLRPDLQIEEAPQPTWAGAMEQRLTDELRRNRTLIEALAPADIREAAARVIERLEALPLPDDAARDETDGGEDRAAAAPPGPGPGSRRGRVDG